MEDFTHAAPIWVAIHCPKAVGFLVCMKTVPGPIYSVTILLGAGMMWVEAWAKYLPVNLQTKPSPAAIPLIIPPLATLSIAYLQFQATKWSLSTMYCSPGAIYINPHVNSKF